MEILALMSAINKVANETKQELTKSYFSGDKSFYNKMVSMFPKMQMTSNIYENINNLAAKYAQSLEY